MDDLSRVFDSVSRYFALLSEPMRLRILHCICNGPRAVHEIVEETGASQTNVSRHLGLMHRAGVLTRRKEGNLVRYGVADQVLTEICRTVCVHVAARDPEVDPQRLRSLVHDLQPATVTAAAAFARGVA
jgi:DNA-binding transcriptional ArsR family regulator